MAVKGAGTPIEIRTAEGALVDGVLLNSVENFGELADVQQVADRANTFVDYEFSATAALPGQFRLTEAQGNNFAGFAGNQLTGLAHNTPGAQSVRSIGSFWSLGPNNERKIATTLDRQHEFFFELAAQPEFWQAKIADTVTCAVNFDLYCKTKDDDAFPGTADLAISSSTFPGVGTPRTIAIPIGTIPPTRFPCLLRVVITNKGDNSPVEVNRQYPQFPDP